MNLNEKIKSGKRLQTVSITDSSSVLKHEAYAVVLIGTPTFQHFLRAMLEVSNRIKLLLQIRGQNG